MKAIKKRIVLVAFMFTTLFNYANNRNNFNVAVNPKKVRIAFKDAQKGELLTVKDENGIQLHSETIDNSGQLIKFFDLSSLHDGVYKVELNKAFVVVVKSLEVKDNNVFLTENFEKVIFKPIIRTEKNLVLISKTNFEKKPVKIALFYNGDVIFSETVNDEEILKRVYKLDKEIKGDYKVVVYCDDESYSNDFKI
jgi:hypothetical protein